MTSRYCYLRSLSVPSFLYKKELNLKLKKSLFYDFNNCVQSKISFKLFIALSSKEIYKTKLKRRCIVTGRSRAIDNESCFSRFVVKKKIISGDFTGYKKSS